MASFAYYFGYLDHLHLGIVDARMSLADGQDNISSGYPRTVLLLHCFWIHLWLRRLATALFFRRDNVINTDRIGLVVIS